MVLYQSKMLSFLLLRMILIKLLIYYVLVQKMKFRYFRRVFIAEQIMRLLSTLFIHIFIISAHSFCLTKKEAIGYLIARTDHFFTSQLLNESEHTQIEMLKEKLMLLYGVGD